jgi:hypothetical protein
VISEEWGKGYGQLVKNARKRTTDYLIHLLVKYELPLQRHQTDFLHLQSKTAEWPGKRMFRAFPDEATGLRFYILDCWCIYNRRQAPDGALDTQIGIYRDPTKDDCGECMPRPNGREARVLDEMVIYKIKLEFVS